MKRTGNSFTDGTPVQILRTERMTLTRSYSSFSAQKQLTTGLWESESVGSALIFLAAQPTGWHRIPWRMLRNAYLDLASSKRESLKNELSPPTSLEAAAIPEVTEKFETLVKLVTGLEHLTARGLIEVSQGRGGETYFLPTDSLLDCVTER